MTRYLKTGCLAIIALASSAPIFAFTGTGDSAPGNLDTVPPNPGTASPPPTGTIAGFDVPFTGVSDFSAIASVELWVREDSSSWAGFVALVGNNTDGTLPYYPPGTGLYHFELVAQDVVGNRSPQPSGTTGTGQGSTLVSANVAEWSVIDQ